MDIAHLKYFSKVYETLNYRRSAEELFISRQALKKAINKLEHEIGTPLFSNEANSLIPTSAADVLYRASRAAVRGFKDIEIAMATIKENGEETIRLGQSFDANSIFSTAERAAFGTENAARQSFKYKISLRTSSCCELRNLLLRGEIDYAHILTMWEEFDLFDFLEARTGRLYLAVPQESPLAQYKEVALSNLGEIEISLPEQDEDITEFFLRESRLKGINLNIVRYENNLFERLYLTQSRGVPTITYSPAMRRRFTPNVVAIPFAGEKFTWHYGVLSKHGLGDPEVASYFAGKKVDWDSILSCQAGGQDTK